MFANPPYPRNCMKCPDLHRKLWFARPPYHLGQKRDYFLIKIACEKLIEMSRSTEKNNVFNSHPYWSSGGVRFKSPQNCFWTKHPDQYKKHTFTSSQPLVGWDMVNVQFILLEIILIIHIFTKIMYINPIP